jgi:hypothetical protein
MAAEKAARSGVIRGPNKGHVSLISPEFAIADLEQRNERYSEGRSILSAIFVILSVQQPETANR